jgi:hypothetical protein
MLDGNVAPLSFSHDLWQVFTSERIDWLSTYSQESFSTYLSNTMISWGPSTEG